MNEKVNFNIRLEADPSKLAEQELFAKMVDKFEGTNTYLAMFFTEALLNWVTEQIDNDFPPDVKATIELNQDERAQAITAMREANTAADAAEREHEQARRQDAAVIAELERDVEGLTNRLHDRGLELTIEINARARNQERNDRYKATLARAHDGFERMRGYMVAREKQWKFAMDQVLKRE